MAVVILDRVWSFHTACGRKSIFVDAPERRQGRDNYPTLDLADMNGYSVRGTDFRSRQQSRLSLGESLAWKRFHVETRGTCVVCIPSRTW